MQRLSKKIFVRDFYEDDFEEGVYKYLYCLISFYLKYSVELLFIMNRETSLVKKHYIHKAPTGTFFISFINPFFA